MTASVTEGPEAVHAVPKRTFRRIRPAARLGHYTGQVREPDAEVLFASILTLGRPRHLEQFSPTTFDSIVVDEFHHAAAPTYRRLIRHFRPPFLLGLTATPERTDGGDLLALCEETSCTAVTCSKACGGTCCRASSTSACRTKWTTRTSPGATRASTSQSRADSSAVRLGVLAGNLEKGVRFSRQPDLPARH
ncbi:MAG: DEAD/DEAH box helicase family protein, partial [Vicinamibacteria bacterium]